MASNTFLDSLSIVKQTHYKRSYTVQCAMLLLAYGKV